MKISLTVKSFRTNTIFILNVPKENNSEKKKWSYGSCFLHTVRRSFILLPSFMKILMAVLKLQSGHEFETNNFKGKLDVCF